MTKQNNAASKAVKAAALSNPAPHDVFDCIAADIPREQWAEAMADAPQKLAAVDCSSVFGVKWPEDVIAPIRVAVERLNQLQLLFASSADDPAAG